MRSFGLLAVLIAALACAAPARADIYTVFPSDEDGAPVDSYRSDEAIYAHTFSSVQAGDVCVVPASTELLPDGEQSCEDAAVGWASPNAVPAADFWTPIKGPFLELGTWRLLGDGICSGPSCDPDSLSEPFTVYSCQPGCDQTIAAAALGEWKDWAAGPVADAAGKFCAAGKVFAPVGPPVRGAGRGSTGVQAARTVGDFVDDAAADKTGQVTAVLQEPDPAARRQFLGGFAYSAYSAGILFGVRAAYNAAIIGIGESIVCHQKAVFDDIAADPPRADYDTVQPPELEAWPSTQHAGGDDLVDALEVLRGYARAQLVAAERYQGAVAAGADVAAHKQAVAIRDFGEQMVKAMRRAVTALHAYRLDLEGTTQGTDPLVTQPIKDLLVDLYDRVRTSGFTASELSQLQALGLTPEMIAAFRAGFDDDISAIPVDTAIATVTGELETALHENEAGVQTLAGAADNAAAATDTAPDAGFTATPGHGPAPLHVAFADTSTDAEGDVLTATWDFGDGTTGTGLSPEHDFAADGSYTVVETVSDGFQTDTAQETILVADNVPPTAEFTFTQDGPTVDVDAAPSSDLDGTVEQWDWDWGDGATTSGETSSHTYATAGTHTVTLTVTDDSGATGTTSHDVAADLPDPPDAVDDSLTAPGAEVADVLMNDSDPDGDPLAVTGHTAPAHGTVECQPLGGCLYEAAEGYTGPDAFDYAVADTGGLTDTATVTIAVEAVPATGSATAVRDDTAATQAPDPVTVDVLANDETADPPMQVGGTVDPHHGTVTCESDGRCTYTPAAGFSGNDGFAYSMLDGTGTYRPGNVGVTVAPAGAGYGLAVHGAPDSILQGETASWTVAMPATPDGISGAALRGVPAPSVSTSLAGSHAVEPGSVTTAAGWTGGLPEATAGPGALLGEAASSVIPSPAPIGQGTGGDGHVPILVGGKVFAFFHHSHPTSVSCVDRATGSLCPGYPRPVNGGTTDINGPGAVVGTKIYVHLVDYSGGQSSALSLYCWDAAQDQPCGLFPLARVAGPDDPRASHPVLVDGRVYVAGDPGRLYCLDPATNDPCPGSPWASGLGSSDEPWLRPRYYDIATHGTRIYMARSSDNVSCFDVATQSLCTGWAAAKDLGSWNLVNHHSPAGVADGVCAVLSGSGSCVLDSDPGTVTALPSWLPSSGFWDVTEEAETGRRTLAAYQQQSGLYCWDWKTLAVCTGGEYTVGGLFPGAIGESSASGTPYGAAFDGRCVVGLGDPGYVFTVDPAGHSSCPSLPAPPHVDLRDQRCDGGVGGATFRRVQLTDAEDGDFSSLTVTVRDAETGAVLATGDIAAGPVSLAGVDPAAHPAIVVEAKGVGAGGSAAWDDSLYPRIDVVWDADPQPLCFRTTTTEDCAGPLTPISVTAALGPGATADASVALRRAACPPALATPADQTVAEGAPLDLTVAATDPNGDPPTYALVSGPPGMSIDPATGRLAWTPGEEQGPAEYTVKVRASDPGGLADEKAFTLTVGEVNRPPELGAVADRKAQSGDAVSVALSATDPDAPANHLAFSLLAGPEGAAVDPVSGTVAWSAAGAGAHAFRVRVSDDGTPALGAEREFTVTVAGQGAPSGETAAEIVLGCADRKVVLEDVVPVGRRVRLVGIADPAFAGRTVKIVFGPRAKVVATAKVAANGSFSATAPLPARRLRSSNKARYQARVGRERSLSLKLLRRMRITAISAYGGSVQILGRVLPPLAARAKDRAIKLQQALSCGQPKTIKRFKPRSNGTFAVTVPAPAGQAAAVYRLQTKVRRNRRSRRVVKTFTLPRAVDFG